MLAVLSVEIRKLNRSLALLLCLAAPTLIAIFGFFNMLRGDEPSDWEMWLKGATGIWAFFMLPMSVTALTALVGQMEHAPRSWDHLRALPIPRWKIYAAKAICVLGLVAMMSMLNLAFSLGAVALGSAIKPVVTPVGHPDLAGAVWLLTKVFLASVLMVSIQFWTALRFASFVPAMALGIGGTFFAVVATSAKQGVFFPWQMAVNMMGEPGHWRHDTALALGCGLGLVAMAGAIVHLSRREVR